MRTQFPDSTPFLFDSGRGALRRALEILRRKHPERSEVVIPAYICPSVIEAVEKSGCTPIAAPVKDNLNLDESRLETLLSPRTLCVIAVHMYGAPADIAAIDRLCDKHGAALIDDAAQSFWAGPGQQLLGTGGDYGVISFAQSKAIAAGFSGAGGALLVNRGSRPDAFEPSGDNRRRVYPTNALSYLVMQKLRAPYSVLRFLREAGALSPHLAAEPIGDRRSMSWLHARIALAQFSSLDARMKDKIRVARLYATALDGNSELKMAQPMEDRPLMRIMLEANSPAEAITSRLSKTGIATRRPYPAPAVANQDDALTRRVSHMFEAPSNFGLNAAEISRIVEHATIAAASAIR